MAVTISSTHRRKVTALPELLPTDNGLLLAQSEHAWAWIVYLWGEGASQSQGTLWSLPG